MRFEWDDAKDRVNRRKHGIGFATAALVFDDPLHLSRPNHVVDGEERWITIGVVDGFKLVVVAHTYRDDDGEMIVRIISARKASRHERRDYEEG